jgi:negative regulator of sigma E activity
MKNKFTRNAAATALCLAVIVGVTTYAGFNAPQSVGYYDTQPQTATGEYARSNSVEAGCAGSYVKSSAENLADRLTGC